MRPSVAILALCGLIISAILVSGAFVSQRKYDTLNHQVNSSVKHVSNEAYWRKNSGSISSLDGESVFTTEQLESAVPPLISKRDGYFYFWGTVNDAAVASTLGSDRKHHFVQGYLSKFMPFETDKLWIPLKAIAMRKRYEYDEKQYNGYVEIWQNSIEAYENTRGDCEDHSMILCDWLNALGYEARVVCGYYKQTGHAWVVLYADGKEFILEATQKRNLKNNGHYPLASLLPEYRPEFMFDHEFYYLPETFGELGHGKNKWRKVSVLKRNVALL